MDSKPYGMICPITKACEILEPRWTIPILTEMQYGSTRFNDLRRGIGNVSPSLLSKRLKHLEQAGLIERLEDRSTGAVDYIRTQKAYDLEPVLEALARWAQRHIDAELALCQTNVPAMMWKMRKYILVDQLPNRRVVIRFHFKDDGLDYDTYWAVVQPGAGVEMCVTLPKFEVDLYVETTVKSFAALVLSRSNVTREQEAGRLFLSGDALLARTMSRWLVHTKLNPEEGAALLEPDPIEA